MKYLLLLISALMLSACDTIGAIFEDDIEQIESCSNIALDVAEAKFTQCSLSGNDPVDCLQLAKDASNAAFESCLK